MRRTDLTSALNIHGAYAKIEYAQITHINVINANKCMHYTAGCLYIHIVLKPTKYFRPLGI